MLQVAISLTSIEHLRKSKALVQSAMLLTLMALPFYSFADTTKQTIQAAKPESVIAKKTSRAYLQRFTCPASPHDKNSDCFLYFQPYEIGGMTIQAVCNDCFIEWQKQRNTINTIELNNRLALIQVELQPYRDTGKNWYSVKWLTLIE